MEARNLALRRCFLIQDVEAKLVKTLKEGYKLANHRDRLVAANIDTKEWDVALHSNKREVALLYQGVNLHRQHTWAWDHALHHERLISHGRP